MRVSVLLTSVNYDLFLSQTHTTSICNHFFRCPYFPGHYIPQLAELVFDRNKDKTKYPFINLKGFIVSKSSQLIIKEVGKN